MRRSFNPRAPLRSAVDELPYLRKLYAEIQPAAVMAWAADELRDIRRMVEDAREDLAVNAAWSAFEQEGQGLLRLDRYVLHRRMGQHWLALFGVRKDGTPFKINTDLFQGDLPAQARRAARALLAEQDRAAAARRVAQTRPTPQLHNSGDHRMAPPLSRLSKLASVPGEIDKLYDGMERRAEKFLNRIQGHDARGDTVFTKADQKLEATVGAALDGVDAYLDEIEKASNGGPLDGSGK